ncbi:TPA: inositol 2-dehydrogenase [Raoultella planticola]
MFKVALLGSGRIAKVHAKHIHENPNSMLFSVSGANPDSTSAQELAIKYDAQTLSVDEAINHSEVDIVLIATPNHTHADYAVRAARAGKAILTEKPIDLDVARVRACIKEIEACGVPFMIGFNRRFDPHHSHLRRALQGGEIGVLEHLMISSRDAAPPTSAHLAIAGGIYCDSTIHDFDMARFILGEDPVLVSAIGAALVNEDVQAAGDIDTSSVTLQTASGKIVVINNSRRSGYGYDQRIEAHGQKGSLQVRNPAATALVKLTEQGVESQKPFYTDFDRYKEAFCEQWQGFVQALKHHQPVPINAQDGLKALLLAKAAQESLRTQRVVRIDLTQPS